MWRAALFIAHGQVVKPSFLGHSYRPAGWAPLSCGKCIPLSEGDPASPLGAPSNNQKLFRIVPFGVEQGVRGGLGLVFWGLGLVWGFVFFLALPGSLDFPLRGGGAASSRNGFPSRREEDAPLPRQRRRAPPGGAAVLRGRERHGGLRGGAARAAEAEGQRWGSGGRQAVRGRRGNGLGGRRDEGTAGWAAVTALCPQEEEKGEGQGPDPGADRE